MDEKNFEQILADALEKQRQELTQEFNEKLLVAIPEIQAAVKDEIEGDLNYYFQNSKETDFVYKSDISEFSENYAKKFVENDVLSKAGQPTESAVVTNQPAPVFDDTPIFDPWADEPPIVKVVEQSPGRADLLSNRVRDPSSTHTESTVDFDPWADETPADITPDMLAEVAGAESFLQEHAATAPKTVYDSNINWKPMLATTDPRLSEKTMEKELGDKSFFSAAKFDQVRNYYDNTKSPTEFGMFSSGEHREKYKALNEKAVADLGYGTTLKEMQTIQTKELALAHQVSNISRPEFNNTGMNPDKIVDIVEKKHDFERKYFQFRDNQEQGIANSKESVKAMRESYMDYKAAAIGKDWRFEYKDKTQEAVKEIQVSPTQVVEVVRPNAPKLSDYSHANQEMIKRGEQRLAQAGAVNQSVFKDVKTAQPKQAQVAKGPESATVEKQEPKPEPEQKKQFSLDSKPKIANKMQEMRQKMELVL